MRRSFAGFDFGATMTSVFRVNTTGAEQRFFVWSCAGSVMFADAKRSAGAPCWICAASVFDPPNEYRAVRSICGNTFVSDAAAYTVTCADARVDADGAARPETATAAARRARIRRGLT